MISTSAFSNINRANWLMVDGNSIEYAKDNDGNIIAEIYKQGEAVQFVIHHEYDANGDIVKSYTDKEL